MKSLPKIGIIFPSKDDGAFVGTTLWLLHREVQAYLAMGGKVDVSLVNDGSTDRTTEMLRAARDHYGWKLLEQPTNKGVTVSMKDGFEALDTDTEVIVRCDADAIFIQEGWLAEMVEFLLSDERTGVIAPQMILPHAEISCFGMQIFPEGEQEIHRGDNIFMPGMDIIREVDTIYGAYSMMRRSDWTIDTGYFLWIEDEDQGLTARKNGKKNFCLGTIKLSHYNVLRPLRMKHDKAAEKVMTRSKKLKAGIDHAKTAFRIMGGAVLPEREAKQTKPKEKPMNAEHPDFDWRVYHPLRRKSVEHFEQKWGFSILKPDLSVVREKYAGTELLWWDNSAMQQAGKSIIENYLTKKVEQYG